MKNKLRIGILLDSNYVPAWFYAMVDNLNKSNSSEVVLVVKNKGNYQKKKDVLYRTFARIENRIFKATPNAFELMDLHSILSVDTIEVVPRQTKRRDSIDESDLKKMEKYKIDVFIQMGFRVLSGAILDAAKYGVWSYHHSDTKVNRGEPAGFWEVVEKHGVTGVSLQILTENADNNILLHRSYSLTNDLSPTMNRNSYYWKAACFLPDKIEELYNIGSLAFFEKVDKVNSTPQFYSDRFYQVPTNKEMLRLGPKLLFRYVITKIKSRYYFDQWILLFHLNKREKISTSFYKFTKMIPPKDRFWADPFVIRRNGKYYIFLEELMYATDKGHISLIIMDDDGNYSSPKRILEKEYHLSYPFLIEDDGTLYMIPETYENNRIELYKCTKFPDKWELEKVLIDNIIAFDATIRVKDGKYWMFVNVMRNKGASSLDELLLFSSEKLVSDNWVAHPQNPIISDVKQARPAGAFFTYKENLYRPSQNSSIRYGYGMKINQVVKLNEEEYEERTVDAIFPNWDQSLIATHTINSVKNITVIDAQMKRRRFF